MKIIKANEKHLSDCALALEDSELGRNYFSKEGSALEAVREGLSAGTLYVAVEDETVLGFMYYIPNGAFHSFPYLHLFVVSPKQRGSGIGTKMLSYLEQIVGRNRIFLSVADFNPQALRFYEKNGYTLVGTVKGLYRKGTDENLMMKIID